MTVTLDVAKREKSASAKAIRNEGGIPAVVYGPKQESIAITLDKKIFEKTLKEAGESTIITLKGIGTDIDVLVHDVAFNPERGGVLHVDFYAIESGKELTTHVGLTFIGEAPAVKLGGSLTKVLHEVEVTCLPTKLPAHIEVDVSGLTEFGMQIKVSDLVVPSGVKIENDPDEVIAVVSEAEEEVEEEPQAVDMDSIAVEQKGKTEEEGEAKSK